MNPTFLLFVLFSTNPDRNALSSNFNQRKDTPSNYIHESIGEFKRFSSLVRLIQMEFSRQIV
jgi:hypothetical protein